MVSSNATPHILNCTFFDNESAGIYCTDHSEPVIIGCTFFDNQSAGIHCNGYSEPVIIGCTFTNCRLSGVYSVYSNPQITNCLFYNNVTPGGGGAIYLYSGQATITDCTIVRNTADAGGGIACLQASPVVANCVLRGNTPNEIQYGNPSVTYCNVEGGWTGEGNIDADPLFIDPDGGDFRLSSGSPAIDAGDNEAVPADTGDLDEDGDFEEPIPFDLYGNPRFADDPGTDDTGNGTPPIVDMGACEFHVCLADLDGDNDTDQADLGILLADWGCTGGDCVGDLNGDGNTDQVDLGILLADWGCGLEP